MFGSISTIPSAGPLVLNRTNSLNAGLIGDWTILPQNYGGGRLIDMVGENHGFFGTDIAGNPLPKWQSGVSIPSGLPSIRYQALSFIRTAIPTGTGGLSLTGGFTLSILVNFQSTGTQFPVSSRDAGATKGIFILWENGQGPEIGFMAAGNLTRKRWGTNLNLSQWYHVTGTHVPGSTSLSLYVDDVSGGTMSETAASDPANSGVAIAFGRDGSVATGNSFVGLMSSVRLYNRPLPQAEIAALRRALYQGGLYVPAWSRSDRVQTISTFAKSGSASLIFTATSSQNVIYPVAGSASLVLTAVGSAVGLFPRPGAASLVFTAAASSIGHFVRPAAASLVFTATTSAVGHFVRPAAASLVYTASASALGEFVRPGAASLVYTATAGESVIFDSFRLSTLSTLILTPAGYGVRGLSGPGAASLVFTAAASGAGGSKTVTCATAAQLVFRARAKIPGRLLVPGEPEYVGRYQVGAELSLRLGDVSLPPVTYQAMDRPGRHLVISYSRSGPGIVIASAAIYEVVPGGDPSGAVLAAYSLPGPANDNVLAHLEEGALVTGRGPYLDEGV